MWKALTSLSSPTNQRSSMTNGRVLPIYILPVLYAPRKNTIALEQLWEAISSITQKTLEQTHLIYHSWKYSSTVFLPWEPNSWASTSPTLSYDTLEMPKLSKIKQSNIPKEIIHEYTVKDTATPNGWRYIHCIQGMCNLSQAVSLMHDILEDHFNAALYSQRNLILDCERTIYIPSNSYLLPMMLALPWWYQLPYQAPQTILNISADDTGKEYVKINMDWDSKNNKMHI